MSCDYSWQPPLFDPSESELKSEHGLEGQIGACDVVSIGPADMVRQFHEVFGVLISDRPTVDLPPEVIQLRLDLLREELAELESASEAGDLVAVADGLGDLAYVLYGAALTFGIDLDAVVREIHRSNMTKLDEVGRPILRADGKVLKGPRYQPPDIQVALWPAGQGTLQLVVG